MTNDDPARAKETDTKAARPKQTRGFWPMRDLPAVGWLLAAVVVALLHAYLPAPRWLLIHLVLLGAATHSILVWSRYFADALLHTAPDPTDRARQSRRLGLLNLGVLLVLLGVLDEHWSLAVTGGVAVAVAVLWHGAALLQQLRSALPARFGITVRYYLAAATLLPFGVTVGVLLARIQSDPWHQRLLVVHASINLLGWIGITALGTLMTLWATMLRTRIAAGAEKATARALPVLLAGVALAAIGPLIDVLLLTVLGLVLYLLGLLIVVPPMVSAARVRPPTTFPTLSVAGALIWLAGCLAALVVALIPATSWTMIDDRFTWFTPFLAVGFGAQLLLGASSYLIPVVLGGGPGPVRAATNVLDWYGAGRVVATNAALLVCILPLATTVRVLASVVVLVSLASFLPLLILGMRASRAVRAGHREAPPITGPGRTGLGPQVAVALVVVLLFTGSGFVLDQQGLNLTSDAPVAAGVTATGNTTVVKVAAKGMRFHPAAINVPAGDRLVIKLTNTDKSDVHDLVLDDGTDSGRLSPGASTRLDVGVVGRDVAGWCSVLGHRQMGMVFSIHAVGAELPEASSGHTPGPSTAQHPDLTAAPGPLFRPRDAMLPAPLPGRVHRRTLHVREVVREVAPGVTQRLWTYNGLVPGPTLHGRIGDRFVITLINDASMGHSIDFHAGSRAPDQVMRTIPPGGRLVYRFTADRAGIWMYHCSTMPMSAHIANGLFGAVVIDPPGLAPVDRSFLLTQSELYLGANGHEVDVDKVLAEQPDLVVFNGYANTYDQHPLHARVGERIRIWVLDVGPNRATAFHVVGAQFDAAYAEGAWLLRRGSSGGSQSLALGPSQGGFVELTFTEPGHYPFISHVMVDAERGAHGTFAVTR